MLRWYTRSVPFFGLLNGALVLAQQIPLTSFPSHDDDHYQFQWPIRKVAVIGAGVGGLIANRELTHAGLDVHIFERDEVPGGNWHYTEDIPKGCHIPNLDPVFADYKPSLPPPNVKLPYTESYEDAYSADFENRRVDHRGPTPLWESLRSNAPAPVQQIAEFPWPKNITWELPHQKLQAYLRAFASWHGVNSNDNNPRVSYNTRVEAVSKRLDASGHHAGWTLTLKTYIETGDLSANATWWEDDFDAIVVATGRYNAPNAPVIPGLESYAAKHPGQVTHSRQYRHPKDYKDETVLVIGASRFGNCERPEPTRTKDSNFYQDTPIFPTSRIPSNVSIVGEIGQIISQGDNSVAVELANGTIITGITQIILSTGYRYTFPFLSQYHNPSLGPDDRASGEQPLVTDGSHIRSLYLDTFFIEEPTIGFINMNVGMQSFAYSEYTTLSLGKVWSGTAKLPSKKQQWEHHYKAVEERGGYGKGSMFLGQRRSVENTRFFAAWLNAAAVVYGGRQIDTYPDSWFDVMNIWSVAHYGSLTGFNDVGQASHSPDMSLFLDDW